MQSQFRQESSEFSFVFVPLTPEEQAASDWKNRQAVEGIAAAARRFLATYDEFWPEYPETIGEPLDTLMESFNALGD